MTLTIEKQPIPAERLVARSPISYATAESRLRSSIQKPKDSKEKVQLTDKKSFDSWVQSSVGPHGFMYFEEYNHTRWLPFFEPPNITVIDENGEKRFLKAIRFILGNPAIAVTMLRHDLNAGLCVPVELYLAEEAQGGVRIVWYKPTGLIAGYEGAKQELVDAANALSVKLENFIRWVLREEEGEGKL
jgi:hypothetical protein